ncbi:MAG: putative sulfate exporter family transporter [Rhizobiaceae bacterium]|nr:putative sulfate exporter family transporter [Rhizobiaceae bacterium]
MSNGLLSVAHTRAQSWFGRFAPGIFACVTAACAAQFLGQALDIPVMLAALVLGFALSALGNQDAGRPGIDLVGGTVLRTGVALLGVRISADLLTFVEVDLVLSLTAMVLLTIAFGLVGAKVLGRGWRLGLLTGGAVAICGASAAIALSSVIPRNEHSDSNLIFTVISVTVLSTIAMIAYPLLSLVAGLDQREAGILLGATVHNVAQVVGASFSVSPDAGVVATLIKMMRVALLAPLLVCLSLMFRARTSDGVQQPPLLPSFLVGFAALSTISALDLLPSALRGPLGLASDWALLCGIAAAGMKASAAGLREVGASAFTLIVAESVFIATVVLCALKLMS